jgi:hypothetical protein
MKNAPVIILLLQIANAFIGGAVHQLFGPEEGLGLIDALFILIGLGLVFVWFRIDAKGLDFQPSPILNISVIGVTAIALPYYFFRTRGPLRGLLATFWFFGIAVLLNMVQMAGGFAVFARQI